jgi:exodeoxyribonuclease VII large subunit
MSRPLFDPVPPPVRRQVFTVTQLNQCLRQTLQERFPSVWVAGEIADLARPHSGHVYLSLKDDEGQLRAVIWRGVAGRLPFDLKDGMQVICEGQIDVYPPRGTYQLVIRQLEPRGVGALQLALVQLRERLAAEGL